jgi:hypothetical protein
MAFICCTSPRQMKTQHECQQASLEWWGLLHHVTRLITSQALHGRSQSADDMLQATPLTILILLRWSRILKARSEDQGFGGEESDLKVATFLEKQPCSAHFCMTMVLFMICSSKAPVLPCAWMHTALERRRLPSSLGFFDSQSHLYPSLFCCW